MPFTGQAEATIDAKQRLALPAKFRARWNPKKEGATWFSVPWPANGVIRLYTEQRFEQLARATQQDATLTPSQDRADLDTVLFSHTEQLDVDANHRIRIPEWQLELVSMPKEVVVLGAGDRLEVRSRDAWQAERSRRFADMQQLATRVQQSHPTGRRDA